MLLLIQELHMSKFKKLLNRTILNPAYAPNPLKSDKGLKFGSCNRTACQAPGANYYNHTMHAYYCKECALLLNKINHTMAMDLYGHEMCMPVEE